ncbi:MAG: hypothetical protein ACKV2O_19155 [Acidimicrobiales bacterium]
MVTAVVVVGSFGFWGYALSGTAAKDPPDTLTDENYRRSAQALCQPLRDAIDALPPAPSATSPQDRAEVLGVANDRVVEMVAGLRTLQPDPARDQRIVTEWLADWERYLTDRGDYLAVLREGRDEPFRLTLKDGNNYTKAMDNLAEINDMPACATPGDV